MYHNLVNGYSVKRREFYVGLEVSILKITFLSVIKILFPYLRYEVNYDLFLKKYQTCVFGCIKYVQIRCSNTVFVFLFRNFAQN